jgi:hypothetical protein
MRIELGLVIHLGTVLDEVPQVHIGQPQLLGLIDLPKHIEGPKACPGIRIKEGVNSRESVIEDIQDRDHAKRARLTVCASGFAKLGQSGIHPGLKQELNVLIHTIGVHPAALMASHLVFQIQFVVFFDKGQAHHSNLQMLVCLPCSLLASAGTKGLCWNSERNASFALIAMRSVGEHARAAKTLGYQIGVDIVVDQVSWGSHLRARQVIAQVTALIRSSGVKLQTLKRKIVGVGHGFGLCCGFSGLKKVGLLKGTSQDQAKFKPMFALETPIGTGQELSFGDAFQKRIPCDRRAP